MSGRRIARLYTTVGCHLCEEAATLLHEARSAGLAFDVCEVEISDSESLMEAYGIRIPVVRFDGDKRELGWPFDYQDLIEFIESLE